MTERLDWKIDVHKQIFEKNLQSIICQLIATVQNECFDQHSVFSVDLKEDQY